jgi:hypothetical protein
MLTGIRNNFAYGWQNNGIKPSLSSIVFVSKSNNPLFASSMISANINLQSTFALKDSASYPVFLGTA